MFSDQYWIRNCIVFTCLLQLSHGAFLRCYNGSLDDYLMTPLSQPLTLSPCINTALPTVIYTFGYRGRVAGPATTAVLTAYITKKKRNVILLDWEAEAKSGVLGIPLGYVLHAVPNAKKVGMVMGEALIQLATSGLSINDIQLVGHSLGAHVMAYAGKHARERGHVVGRITGLDPARALFEGTLAVQTGLDRTCAKFVDIVHTDPGGYGLSDSYGTVDIWPNLARNRRNQPGCPAGEFEAFSREDLCSHDRSWQYLVEALSNPTAFPAMSAKNFEDWIAGRGQTNHTIYIGDLTSTRARGNFYLKTNPTPPFGMGVEGMEPGVIEARRRRNPTFMSWLRLFTDKGDEQELISRSSVYEEVGRRRKYTNFEDWIAGRGQTNHTIYIGDLTSTRARGNFYLKTNPTPPFGMGVEGMEPGVIEARRRRNPTFMSWLRLFT